MLHTRISESLAHDIHRLADSLRVPVSNLVRNVLEEAFSVVESVSDNVGDLVEDVLDEAERISKRYRARSRERGHARPDASRDEAAAGETRAAGEEEAPPRLHDVVGWQPIVLNHDRSCASCGTPLRRGRRGFAGVSERGLSGDYLCRECVARHA